MSKVTVFILILGAFFVFNANIVFADESFAFNETFNTSNRINTKNTYAKIEGGKVFTADDSVSSRVESLNIARSLYNIDKVKIEVAQNLPAGSRILYFVSGNKGKTWLQVEPNFFYDIGSDANNLRWAAVLARNSTTNPSPSIENLRIIFSRDTSGRDGISAANNSNGEIGEPSFVGDFYNNVEHGLCSILGTSCAQGSKTLNSSGTASVAQAATYNSGGSNSGNISTANQNSNGNGNGNLQRPVLLRANGTKDVFYVTRRGLKRLVPNPQVFLSYGNKWSDVIQADQAVLDSYPENKYVFFEAANPHRKVYKIEGGKKYPISEDEVKKLGLKNHEIAPVNRTELDYYKSI